MVAYWTGDFDIDLPDRPTDIMVAIRTIPFKCEEQLMDPNHEDARKFRKERKSDRGARDRFVKFYKDQGVKGIKARNFTFSWTRGCHPSLNMVRILSSRKCHFSHHAP